MSGKRANVSKAWPTTTVMSGGIAAAHRAARIAGTRIMASLRAVRERRRRKEGWGGTYGSLGGSGWLGEMGESAPSNFSSTDIGLRSVLRVEERVVSVAVGCAWES